MADLIQAIFVTPGLAFARLGGSSTPQFAYDWIDTRAPRADGETSIAPTWTIAIQPDGSPAPFMPDSVTFRDGDLVRPVAPFYEIWARVGDTGRRAARSAADAGAVAGERPCARGPADESDGAKPEGGAAHRQPAIGLRHVPATDDQRQQPFAYRDSRHQPDDGTDADDSGGPQHSARQRAVRCAAFRNRPMSRGPPSSTSKPFASATRRAPDCSTVRRKPRRRSRKTGGRRRPSVPRMPFSTRMQAGAAPQRSAWSCPATPMT